MADLEVVLDYWEASKPNMRDVNASRSTQRFFTACVYGLTMFLGSTSFSPATGHWDDAAPSFGRTEILMNNYIRVHESSYLTRLMMGRWTATHPRPHRHGAAVLC